MKLEIVIKKWQDDIDDIKTTLYNLGEKADSLQYNLLSAEALRLSMCINDLREWQLEEMTSVKQPTL